MTDKHTQTPWMTQACGELCPDDVMIVADLGRLSNGIQQISTVAKALAIRQTKETTAANAAFIVRACNSHDALVKALKKALLQGEDRQAFTTDLFREIDAALTSAGAQP